MALRLYVNLQKSPDALIDVAIPPVKGHVEVRSVKSEECFTPAGLPIFAYCQIRGDWGEVGVVTVETLLLRMTVHVNAAYAELLLPTDEVIEIAVRAVE